MVINSDLGYYEKRLLAKYHLRMEFRIILPNMVKMTRGVHTSTCVPHGAGTDKKVNGDLSNC